MEAHIRYQASVAPVLEGLVKAGLIEVLEKEEAITEPINANGLIASQVEANLKSLQEAREVLSQNPNFYDEWKKEYDKMREEWD
jgi:hypothetical protein